MANNSLQAQRAGTKPATFSAYMSGDGIRQKINEIVGSKDGQRFITAIISAVSNNLALSECDHSTILSAALLGEGLKLSPSPQLGQYYMVPFNDNKNNRKVATFQLGYKGYIQLAIRSGMYKKLNVLPIKEGELVSFDPLDEEISVVLIDDERKRELAPTSGYYAMFEYTNGFKKAMYWSREKMVSHADKYAPAFKATDYQRILDGKVSQGEMWKYSSFWYKDFDAMACKTMLRQLISKWGVMSIDMQRAFEADDAVIHENGAPEYVTTSADVELAPTDIKEAAPVAKQTSTTNTRRPAANIAPKDDAPIVDDGGDLPFEVNDMSDDFFNGGEQ